MVKFGYSILYVNDVAATLAFYEKAFGFEIKFCTPENDYGELVSGETTMAFASIALGCTNLKKGIKPIEPHQQPMGIEWCFITENVDQTVAAVLSAGGTLLEEAVQKPWGQTVAYAQDINGLLLEICTAIE